MSKVIACGVPAHLIGTHTRDELRELLINAMINGMNAPGHYEGRMVTERFRVHEDIYNLIKYNARFSGRSFHEYTADVLNERA